jgi:flavodoxin
MDEHLEPTRIGAFMKTAVIVYQSRTGITKAFAHAMGEHLKSQGLAVQVLPIGPQAAEALAKADLALLGTWTAGLLILLQKPDPAWTAFVQGLPALPARKIGLFATYKIATGGLFKKMETALQGKGPMPSLCLKSRNGKLSPENTQALNDLVHG